MRTCFVPLCDAKNRDQPNRTMFYVPKDPAQFAQWVVNLPNVKQLRRTDTVCYVHFKPEDVEYKFGHIINGQIYEIQRDRPRLKPNAVPCLEMPSKEELLSYRVKSREYKIAKLTDQCPNQQVNELVGQTQQLENEIQKTILNENVIQEKEVYNFTNTIDDINEINDFIRTEEQTETLTEINSQIDLDIEEITDVRNDNNAVNLEENLKTSTVFNLLYDNIYKVLLPNSVWGLHRCPNRSALCFSYLDLAKMQTTKIISISENGLVQLIAETRLINTIRLVKDIADLEKLSMLINQVDLWRFCSGRSTNENCEIVVEPSTEICCDTDDMESLYFCKVCAEKFIKLNYTSR